MPMTRILSVDSQHPEAAVIAQAAAVIRRGGLVAFPTETVYGLGANALSADAVGGIFRAKERPAYDPLIVHIAEIYALSVVVAEIPEVVWDLAAAFWPGPLTLILRRSSRVPDQVTADGETVAVRLPAHPVARALIAASGVPIAAPSANRFGRVSPTRAEHVLADLAGRVDMVLDGGSTTVGVESTVLALGSGVPTILRPGGVSREALVALLGDVALATEAGAMEGDQPLVSPGTTVKHYAPEAKAILYRGERLAVLSAMHRAVLTHSAAGERVGLLVAEEDLPYLDDLPVVCQSVGSMTSLPEVARRLFESLRALDNAGVSLILARDFGASGLGLAIRDRLTRAASGRVIIVPEGSA
jgi:L-threonylcarbamoyladenylate synthase